MHVDFPALLFHAFLWAFLLSGFGLNRWIAALLASLFVSGLECGLVVLDLILQGPAGVIADIGFLLAITTVPALMLAAVGVSMGVIVNDCLAAFVGATNTPAMLYGDEDAAGTSYHEEDEEADPAAADKTLRQEWAQRRPIATR